RLLWSFLGSGQRSARGPSTAAILFREGEDRARNERLVPPWQSYRLRCRWRQRAETDRASHAHPGLLGLSSTPAAGSCGRSARGGRTPPGRRRPTALIPCIWSRRATRAAFPSLSPSDTAA